MLGGVAPPSRIREGFPGNRTGASRAPMMKIAMITRPTTALLLRPRSRAATAPETATVRAGRQARLARAVRLAM